MKKQDVIRHITIGLTDGITIPFAVAAGLSSVVLSTFTIAVVCIAIAAAGAITMSAGSYLEQKKASASGYIPAALIIGLSYFSGGLITALPYFNRSAPAEALRYCAVIDLVLLFIAGYYESAVNQSNGFVNGIRVTITGAAAALAAFYVAKLFN